MPAEPSQLTAAQRVDSLCDQFEADWRAGKKPRIEDILTASDELRRDALFRALLPVELELRGRAGERLSTTEYKARFPDRVSAVVEIFRALAERSRIATGDTSLSQHSVRTKDGPPRPAGIVVGTGPVKLGRFELVELLGEGAFGQVFRARDPQLDRDVAIKVPREGVIEKEADKERFLREARALATLHHPNICSVYEVGESGGKLYTVMTYIAGKSLAEAIKERKELLPVRQVVMIVRKLALALEAAHAKGVVHRDLKPANIMFDRERKDVVVMDFGLARRAAAGEAEITQAGIIMGTPAYMAPEQARGDSKAVGPQADIYSLGVILYELLSGKRPFTGSPGEVIGKVQYVEPDPPSKWRPDLDPRLVAVCQKAMAKDLAKRYGSMKEFAAALADRVKQPTATASAPSPGPAGKESASEDTLGLQQLFDALSQERKQTKATVEAAIRKAKTPWWLWVACAGIAGLIVAGGIIFFTRTDKVRVTIELTDVDLADKSLSFFLDDEQIPVATISKPIELKLGEHVLVVKRGKDIVVRKLLTVSGGRSPGIKAKDIPPPVPPPPMRSVSSGIDVLADEGFARLKGKRVGLVTNGTGRDKNGRMTIDLLHVAPGVRLVAVFTPEHGLRGEDNRRGIDDTVDSRTGLPVFSLYGKRNKPDSATLRGIDTLVYDMQDVGCQQYTYIATLKRVLEAAAENNLSVVVLDRPNPIGGVAVEGPVINANAGAVVVDHPLPLRYGMTPGELAKLFVKESSLTLNLEVVPVAGWDRSMFFDRTALPWVNPSPNIRNLSAAVLYPGLALLENTPISVGRGTDTPFEWVGAPWINGERLTATLASATLPGVQFEPATLTPTTDRFAGKACNGVRILVKDPTQVESVRIGLTIAAVLRDDYGSLWPADRLTFFGHRASADAFRVKQSAADIESLWKSEVAAFRERRRPFLIYPEAGSTLARGSTQSGFVPLFNGKDLTGWKVHESIGPNPWIVENGALKCTAEHPHIILFSERGDFRDVHVRVECKYSRLGGGSFAVRAPFSDKIMGYRTVLTDTGPDLTGNIALTGTFRFQNNEAGVIIRRQLVPADQWAIVEFIVRRYHCETFVNGERVIDYQDAEKTNNSGHIGLLIRRPVAGAGPAQQAVWFRKVEVKELPAGSPP